MLYVHYLICDFISIASSAAMQEVDVLFTSPVQAGIEFAATVSDVAEQLDIACTGAKLQKVKTFCTQTKDENDIPLFSTAEIDSIKKSESIFDIFDVIHLHWNWHSHHLLPEIIKRIGSSAALELFKKFETKINYKEKLKNFNEKLIKLKKPVPPDYCKMIAIVNVDYKKINLKDCCEIDDFIAEYLREYECTERNKHHSVEFVWLVPLNAVEHLREKASQLREAFEKKSFISFEIHGVTIYDHRVSTRQVWIVDGITTCMLW